MNSYIGRGNNAGPASDIYPLSASVSSSPAILITGTTAAAQTTVHTSDAKAFDAPYIRVDNVGAATVSVFANSGSTATTGNRQFSIAAGSFAVVYAYDVAMSNSGIFGIWSTATAGVFAAGNVSRFFTASSA